MDSVIAAAKPAARRTVSEPPPAITPRMMPRMLTRPSWPPRITSRSQFPWRWASRCPPAAIAAPSVVARTARPSRVAAGRSGAELIARSIMRFVMRRSTVQPDDGADVVVGELAECPTDDLAGDRSHRRGGVLGMEDPEREIEVLSQVVQGEHRRLELVVDKGRTPRLERWRESHEKPEHIVGVEAGAFACVLQLRRADHDLGEHAVRDQLQTCAVSEGPDMPNRAEVLEDRPGPFEV